MGINMLRPFYMVQPAQMNPVTVVLTRKSFCMSSVILLLTVFFFTSLFASLTLT